MRTVLYTAVPLTYMHVLVLLREEKIAFAAQLLGLDSTLQNRTSRYPPVTLASVGKLPCFTLFDAALLQHLESNADTLPLLPINHANAPAHPLVYLGKQLLHICQLKSS